MGTGIKFIDNFLNITLEKKKTLNEFRVFCINKKNYRYLSGASRLYQKKERLFSFCKYQDKIKLSLTF